MQTSIDPNTRSHRPIPATSSPVVDLDAAAGSRRYRDLGRTLEGTGGPTQYTRFLVKNGRRPDPDEATVMGLLMACRVRASDLNFYPLLASGSRRPGGLRREG